MSKKSSDSKRATKRRLHDVVPYLSVSQDVDIGISRSDRSSIVHGMCAVLSDSFTLYVTTHGFHWNVEGPMFNTLHQMFMDQYTELWAALDLIAERIRALGAPAPASYQSFSKYGTIDEAPAELDAMGMVRHLLVANEALVRTIRTALERAENGRDVSTADLLTGRLQVHEKSAWMLRSLLK